jgi:hypothetical protein
MNFFVFIHIFKIAKCLFMLITLFIKPWISLGIWDYQFSSSWNFIPTPKLSGQNVCCLSVRSKGHRFGSPPGYEPSMIVLDCQVSGMSCTLFRKLRPRKAKPTMPNKGYIGWSFCHLYFNLCCNTSIHLPVWNVWLIDRGHLSSTFTMMASGNPGYQVSSSAEILYQTSSSVIKMFAGARIRGTNKF